MYNTFFKLFLIAYNSTPWFIMGLEKKNDFVVSSLKFHNMYNLRNNIIKCVYFRI